MVAGRRASTVMPSAVVKATTISFLRGAFIVLLICVVFGGVLGG